jgi:solute carrier family 34 (sodium-dependent phosphate cotransporter)
VPRRVARPAESGVHRRVLRPVPLFCAQTLAHIAVQRRWVLAAYLITVFIALPALVTIPAGVL